MDETDIVPNINAVTKELRKQSLSVKNRLQSILRDAKFVNSLGLTAIIPNERCGLWYVPPALRAETAYFKSTDGHMNEWSFSLRRLNFHLIPLLEKNGSLAIVDSTRRGKLMPDALLKTVPIWCAVISTAMANRGFIKKDTAFLRTPRSMVSPSERNEISKRIERFVEEGERIHLFDSIAIHKPIYPCWIYPGRNTFEDQPHEDCYTVQCVVASRKVTGHPYMTVNENGTSTSWNYVQGAADDHELWIPKDVCGGKLDANCFWKLVLNNSPQIIDNLGYLLNWLTDEELLSRLNSGYEKLESNQGASALVSDITHIQNKNDTGISLGVISGKLKMLLLQKQYRQVVILSDKEVVADDKDVNALHYKLQASKKGSKQLRAALDELMGLIKLDGPKRILILCDNGKDLGPGVLLAILCKYFDEDWNRKSISYIDKDTVRCQSAAVSQIRKINPSRATLQSINTFLMGSHGPA